MNIQHKMALNICLGPFKKITPSNLDGIMVTSGVRSTFVSLSYPEKKLR